MAERDMDFAELPLETAGATLRRAREQAGLSRADIASRTKIAERHLASIEDGDYAKLASRTYAIGFARNYARALGLDEKEIAEAVRRDFGDMDPVPDRRPPPSFEPGDPARVPTRRLAWLAGLGALAAVAVFAFLWRDFYAPGATLPDIAPEESQATAAPAGAAQPPAASGPVVFTALEPGIWVKFYDADKNQLLEKQMAQDESFTIPPGANGPMLWTARPDALQVTIGGQIVAKIADRQMTVKDVPVSAAALLARGQPVAAASSPAVSAAPVPPVSQPRPATIRVPLTEQPRAASPSPSAAPAPPTEVPAAPAQPSTVSD